MGRDNGSQSVKRYDDAEGGNRPYIADNAGKESDEGGLGAAGGDVSEMKERGIGDISKDQFGSMNGKAAGTEKDMGGVDIPGGAYKAHDDHHYKKGSRG